MSPRPQRTLRRMLRIAVSAMIVYGSWAFVVNHAHGVRAAARASATQAFASFTLTFSMTAVMEALHRTGSTRASRFLRAASGAIGLTFLYTVGLHLLMGSPELIGTVAPSLAIGSVYAVVYSAALGRERPPTTEGALSRSEISG